MELRYVSLENARAPGAPCPGLRRDQVEHGNPHLVQLYGQPQVEIGTVSQDGCSGPHGFRCAYQLAEFAVNTRDVVQHLDQADDGKTSRVDHGPNTRGPHLDARAAEEPGFGHQPAEMSDHARGVMVARGFPRGY